MTIRNLWHQIWSLKHPSKVTCFMWRVCKGCLPAMLALASKQIQVNTSCPWCHGNNESDAHILFDRNFSRTVWAMTSIQNHLVRHLNESCFDMLVHIFQVLTRDQCAMFGIVCWSLWYCRNNWVWNRVNGSAFGVKSTAVSLLY